MKGTHQGRDTATQKVVLEVAGLLIHSQVEGLEVLAIQIVRLPLVAG